MYSNEREAYRQAFHQAWQKHSQKKILEPLEKQLVAIILLHPEYHAWLNSNQPQQEFEIEENPYIHMSLHLAIRDQIQNDRPIGVKQAYGELQKHFENPHQAEHFMMECLGQILWKAQQSGTPPDEKTYLNSLKK